MNDVTKTIGSLLDAEVTQIRRSRDEIQHVMRVGLNALSNARIAATALSAVTKPQSIEADLLSMHLDDDARLREIVAELAGLFVDENVKADDVEVKADGPRVTSEWFTSRYGVAVAYVEPMSDRGPHVMVDGIVLDPSVVAAVIEHHDSQKAGFGAERAMEGAAREVAARIMNVDAAVRFGNHMDAIDSWVARFRGSVSALVQEQMQKGTAN